MNRTPSHRFVTWKNGPTGRQLTLRIAIKGQTLSQHQVRRIEEACGPKFGSMTTRILQSAINLPEGWFVRKDALGYWVGPENDGD